MKKIIPITTLFLDIGGVLLSNGWDHRAPDAIAQLHKLGLKIIMLTGDNEHTANVVALESNDCGCSDELEFRLCHRQCTPAKAYKTVIEQ